MEKDHPVRPVLVNATLPWGLGWSPDYRLMYYVDTPTREIVAFDFTPETGALNNKRTVVKFPDGVGLPAGMTVDADGKLWVAHWQGGRVTRWDPETGHCLPRFSFRFRLSLLANLAEMPLKNSILPRPVIR